MSASKVPRQRFLLLKRLPFRSSQISHHVVAMVGNFLASFALGWSVTTFSGVCACPFDTLPRRMMLASGQPSKFKNTFHASKHIISTEGFFALFRRVTANMLSRIAGAGVLAGYDQLHGFGLETQLRGGLK